MPTKAAFALVIAVMTAAGCAPQPAAARGQAQHVEPLRSSRAPQTSAAALDRAIEDADAALSRRPDDAAAAIALADALLRKGRASGQTSLAIQAETVLRPVLLAAPDRPDARRLAIASLLAQHRFNEALAAATRAMSAAPDEAWVHAAMGDAQLELGDYERAFAAFDRAAAIKPDAASYARIAHGRELTGDLEGAASVLELALNATGPADVEQSAGILVTLGRIQARRGRHAEAARAFARAEHVYPGYEGAALGAATVECLRGNHQRALDLASDLRATPEVLRLRATASRALGDRRGAARAEQELEAALRTDWPDAAALALLLAEQPGRAAEAVSIAERGSRDRRDIFLADALAWAYHQAGRHADARTWSARATRTGIADPDMKRRARAIAAAEAGSR